MRPTLAVLAAAVAAGLAANILGEYELTLVVSLIAGVVIGVGLAELVVGIGRRGSLVLAAIVAVLAAAALLWAGRIDSDFGVAPYPAGAFLGAAVAAAAGGVRTARAPARS